MSRGDDLQTSRGRDTERISGKFVSVCVPACVMLFRSLTQ